MKLEISTDIDSNFPELCLVIYKTPSLKVKYLLPVIFSVEDNINIRRKNLSVSLLNSQQYSRETRLASLAERDNRD